MWCHRCSQLRSVKVTVRFKMLQLIEVPPGEHPVKGLTEPNPRLKSLRHVTICYVCMYKGWARNPALAPRPSMIYCASPFN
jgi:hypothetical protein